MINSSNECETFNTNYLSDYIEVVDSLMFGIKLKQNEFNAEMKNLLDRVESGEIDIHSDEYLNKKDDISLRYKIYLDSLPSPLSKYVQSIIHTWKINDAIVDNYTDNVIPYNFRDN